MEPIEDLYFNWLCAKVVEPHAQNYITLLQILHATEFVWVVPADRHRAADGIDLRQDFLRETNVEREEFWETLPCSMLEFLIAFAKRASFQTDIPSRDWFWEFISNLYLDEFQQVSPVDKKTIDDVLHAFIWRVPIGWRYIWMLPLRIPDAEHKEIEIWYQFCEYVEDRGLV